MTRSSRPYRPDSDLADVVGFVTRVRAPLRLGDYPSPIDLRELLTLPENQVRTRLWLDREGQIAAFGVVDHFDNVLVDAIPGPEEEALTDEILRWAQDAIRLGRTARPLALDASCRSEDSLRVKVLTANGFAPTGLSTITLVRNLQDPIPEPIVPPNWTIRPVRGESEVDALVALHRAAFGTDHLTVEERLSWMHAPHYQPALDLVLQTDRGDLAGYCMGGIEQEANEIAGQRRGCTDPVAVHPQHRGRGAARALIARGMTLLLQQGMAEAVMTTSRENVRMLRVAVSLGYAIETERLWYTKSLA